MTRRQLSRGQRALVSIVVAGTIMISLIGFIGSSDAVLRLAERNGFGWISWLWPVGIDIGITVFLALDLLLTWMRIPLPLLRHLAWVLTGATVVFNAASAWPNLLASAMHGVVPLLFVAAIEAGQLFERTRLGRWVFAPLATMRLFRRRVLWELRSYEEALEHERRRLVYRARLRAQYGRLWRHRAPIDMLLLLKMANLGEALPAVKLEVVSAQKASPVLSMPAPEAEPMSTPQPDLVPSVSYAACEGLPPTEMPRPVVPAELVSGPEADVVPQAVQESAPVTAHEEDQRLREAAARAGIPEQAAAPVAATAKLAAPMTAPAKAPAAPKVPAQGTKVDQFRDGFFDFTRRHGVFPDGEQLSKWLAEEYGLKGRSGEPLSPGHLRRYISGFKEQWEAEQGRLAPAPAAE